MRTRSDVAMRMARFVFPVAAVAGMGYAVHTRIGGNLGLAVGFLALAGGLAMGSVVLSLDVAQRGNAATLALATVTFILDETTWLPIGRWALVGAFAAEFTPVLIALVLLRYPHRNLDRSGRWFIAINFVVALSVAVAVTITYPNWTSGDWSAGPSFDHAVGVRKAWLGAAAAICMVLLCRRYISMSRFDRSIVRPVLVAGLIEVALVATYGLQPWTSIPVEQTLTYLRTWGAAAVALSFLASAVILMRSVSRVGQLPARLADTVGMADLQEALRHTLDDPGLEVRYWLADRQVLVDGNGNEVPEETGIPLGRSPVEINGRGHERLAVLVVEDALLDQETLIESVAALSRFSLLTAQLEADLRFQLQETDSARARLLRTTFEERKRLELDLHDGAQQRLLGIQMLLASVEVGQSSDAATLISRARVELELALTDLRDLAHGIYPEVLSRAGIGPALEHVVSRLPIDVQLDVEQRRWEPAVEGAAYFSATEAITNVCKHAAATTAWVSVMQHENNLQVTIRDNGVGSMKLRDGASVTSLRDRIAAIGGRIAITSDAGQGTTVAFEIPVVRVHDLSRANVLPVDVPET